MNRACSSCMLVARLVRRRRRRSADARARRRPTPRRVDRDRRPTRRAPTDGARAPTPPAARAAAEPRFRRRSRRRSRSRRHGRRRGRHGARRGRRGVRGGRPRRGRSSTTRPRRSSAPKRAAPVVGLARVRIAKVERGARLRRGEGNAEVDGGGEGLEARARDASRTSGRRRSSSVARSSSSATRPARSTRCARRRELLPRRGRGALGARRRAPRDGAQATRRSRSSRAPRARPGERGAARQPRHGALHARPRGRGDQGVRDRRCASPTATRARTPISARRSSRRASSSARVAGARARHRSSIRERATFRSNLGYALQLSGKRAEAIAEVPRGDPPRSDKLASAWINLATALARDPKTRGEARAALETAQALDPTRSAREGESRRARRARERTHSPDDRARASVRAYVDRGDHAFGVAEKSALDFARTSGSPLIRRDASECAQRRSGSSQS